MQGPFEIAVAAIEASNRGEWSRVADRVDAEDLEQWYSSQVHVPDAPVREITAQEIKRHQPDMPDEVAEYQAEQFNKRAEESRSSLHGQFAGVETRADLAKLLPADALTRYLQAQEPGWQFEERIKALDPRLAGYPIQGTLKQYRRAVGIVHDGDERAHVVYKVHWQVEGAEDAEGEIQVASLRKTDMGWRLRLRGELFEHHSGVSVDMRPAEDEAE